MSQLGRAAACTGAPAQQSAGIGRAARVFAAEESEEGGGRGQLALGAAGRVFDFAPVRLLLAPLGS